MDTVDTTCIDSLEEQLNALYEEREYLERELGISDARDIVTMVHSLEAQLIALYQEKEENAL